MAMSPEIKQALRAALKKLDTELSKKEEEDTTIFRVNPISNGHIVTFVDVEDYEVEVPVYDPPGAPNPLRPPKPPRFEKQKRWRLTQREVYCANAAAIKAQVDEALALEEKVRLLIAEGVLSGNADEPGVGSF